MILASLLLMQAAYAPETEAVMNRARREAAEQNAAPSGEVASRLNGMSLYLPAEIAERLQRCIDTAIEDPAKGVGYAREWASHDGGFSAGQCLGFSFARGERWTDAAIAFEGAAQKALSAGSPADAARLWAQAGNATLAGGDANRARTFFDKALAEGLPDGLAKGEIHLDRARALVALGDTASAREDLDRALTLAADDPLAWLLSATLARRTTDLARAAKDIAQAKQLAPDDASVALEAGKIAILSGDEAGAEQEWARVLKLAPMSEQADAAREMINQLDGEGAEASAPAPAQSR